MELKDIESLLGLGLDPGFARKVEGALREVRAGKLPEFIDPSKQRQKLLSDMRERLGSLRSEREESIRRFDVAIRTQEDAITSLENETATPPPDAGSPVARLAAAVDETPVEPVKPASPSRPGRKPKGKPGE